MPNSKDVDYVSLTATKYTVLGKCDTQKERSHKRNMDDRHDGAHIHTYSNNCHRSILKKKKKTTSFERDCSQNFR